MSTHTLESTLTIQSAALPQAAAAIAHTSTFSGTDAATPPGTTTPQTVGHFRRVTSRRAHQEEARSAALRSRRGGCTMRG